MFVSTDGCRQSITWEVLLEKSLKMADFLVESGVARDEVVGISMPTCPEWLYILFGSMLAGMASVSVVFTYNDGSDVIALMQRIRTCSVLFLDPEDDESHWNIMRGLIDTIESDGTITDTKLMGLKRVVFRHPPTDLPNGKTIEQILMSDIKRQTLPEVHESDTTYLFQSSGSTGVPKLVVHTHKSVLCYIRYIHETIYPQDSILFNDRPFMWVGGFPFTVVTGQKRVTTPSVYTSTMQHLTFLVDVVKKERCTISIILPPLILPLMKMKVSSSFSLPSNRSALFFPLPVSPLIPPFPALSVRFCGICRRQYHYDFNTVFRKLCYVFCAKPKEVDPIKLNFSMTNKCFDTTQIYNLQRSIKINWTRALAIGISFLSIENISTRYNILLAQ